MEHKEKTIWLLSLLAFVLTAAVIFSIAPRTVSRLAGAGDSTVPDADVEITAPLILVEPTEEPAPVYDYILNTNTKRFHWPDCKSVLDIYPQNMEPFTGTRDEVLAMGYVACGNCKP